MLQEAILTDDEIASIKYNWSQLLKQKRAVRKTYYDKLFSEDPEFPSLFRDSFLEIDALPDLMQYIYDNMHLFSENEVKIKGLGLKHKTFGVKPKYYPLAKNALLDTLREYLGDDFSEVSQEAWSQLFDLMSDLMIKGSKRK